MTPLLDKASLRSRLRDTRGFMIAEQLTSIVFIGLLCVAVGVGLQVAMSRTFCRNHSHRNLLRGYGHFVQISGI